MSKLKLIVVFIVLVGIVVLMFFVIGNKNKQENKIVHQDIEEQEVLMEVLGNKDDLVDLSINPGDQVSGVVVLAGSVKNNYFFEGNILVNILDKNKKLVQSGFGSAKSDWMTTEPVGFEAVIDFSKIKKGLNYIEIHNDNPSGLSEKNKSILIPVIVN